TAIAGHVVQGVQHATDALPLVDKPPLVLRKRNRQGLTQHRHRCVPPVAEAYPDGKLIALREVDLTGYRNVTLFSAIEFPVHFEVVMQVLPAIARAHEAARSAGETAITSQRQKRAVFPGHQSLSPRNVDLHGRVVPSSYLQVRCKKK